jgi:hypothetical protein
VAHPRYRQKIKGLAEGGDDLAILPGTFRESDADQAAIFAGGLAVEHSLRIPGEFGIPDALVHAGLLGILMTHDVAVARALFFAPWPANAVMEVTVDVSVQLIDAHVVMRFRRLCCSVCSYLIAVSCSHRAIARRAFSALRTQWRTSPARRNCPRQPFGVTPVQEAAQLPR